MKVLNINLLTDNRNKKFVNTIMNNGITINVFRDESNGLPYWNMNYDSYSNILNIYAGKKTDDKNAFTHELLHVIEEINGQPSHQTILTFVHVGNSNFVTLFNQSLINHINNVILHERMLVNYENAGFPKNKFVYDYYKKYNLNNIEKNTFNLTFNNNINGNKLYVLLNSYFTYRFHPNPNIKRHYKMNLIDKYNYLHSDLINDLSSICDLWTNNTILLSTDFFTALLNNLDNWRARNNYSY